MLTVLAMLAQDYILRDAQTSAVAAYGAFQLEREDCVVSDPPIAVLHYTSCMARVRLTWSSADGEISVLYEDNGNLLTRSYRYPVHEEMLDKCRLGGYYMAYSAQSGRAADWQAGTKAFGKVLANCSVIEPKQIESYMVEFEAAAPDFERAAVALRSVASTMFKSLRRCTRLKYSPRHGGPDATVTCTRHEG
jgi:hypothetical protein